MKREFLQGLKVGESPLPKEIIDAIMAENGRDIEAVKARYADYEALQEQLTQAEAAAAKHWEEKKSSDLPVPGPRPDLQTGDPADRFLRPANP